MTTPHLRKSIGRSSRLGLLLVLLLLGCFALSPSARAVCQEGCSGNNTFLGEDALISNTAFNNTAIGWHALFANTTGGWNTATGGSVLQSNTTGFNNTATGYAALLLNTTGYQNTATGYFALSGNTTGLNNTATGLQALSGNSSGTENTAIGFLALTLNSTGGGNTAIGGHALLANTTGGGNIALGFEAGRNLTTGNNNIDIGNSGVAGEAGTIRIGTGTGQHTKTFIAGIAGTAIAPGVVVGITADGQLGVRASSARYKDGIKPMDKASEAILALKPVTFRYKNELDPDGIPQFGLVAEDVEKVNPALVARDEQGKPYTVRYEAVDAMLLNEFLKEHREVQEQKATIAEFKKEIANLTATVKEQGAQIQKVSAQVELSKPAPRTVDNNP